MKPDNNIKQDIHYKYLFPTENTQINPITNKCLALHITKPILTILNFINLFSNYILLLTYVLTRPAIYNTSNSTHHTSNIIQHTSINSRKV